MEQWTFVIAAFGISAATIIGYTLVLRARTRAAEEELRRSESAAESEKVGSQE